jgi:hypothetical protein
MTRPPYCNHEDFPCCGCGDASDGELPDNFGAEDAGDDMNEFADDEPQADDDEPHGSHDLSDDADALASAGFGTDEDYGGCHGGDDY